MIPENTSHELFFQPNSNPNGKVVTISNHLFEILLKDLPNAHKILIEKVVLIPDIKNYFKFNKFIKKLIQVYLLTVLVIKWRLVHT